MASPTVSGIAALLRSQFTDREVYSTKFIQSQIVNTGEICLDGAHTVADVKNAEFEAAFGADGAKIVKAGFVFAAGSNVEAPSMDDVKAIVENGAIKDVASVASKVALGDNYKMKSGSFAVQTKAFEDAIVGKTADEVKNLDMSLVSGCTMPYSPYSFKSVVPAAIANAR